jgi:SAM-dependent methyltransferase
MSILVRIFMELKMQPSPDWYKTFFTGLIVDAWLAAMPPEATAREVEFLRARLQVAPPAKLLDVPCGGGRHSIALAAAGYQMTAVDISPEFLKAARNAYPAVDWQQREMIDLPWTAVFDGAYCFGNSFGYLPDADNPRFLRAVANALKPGARFVLDYPTCLESIASLFMPTSSHQMGDILFERNGRYDPVTGRIVVEYTLTRGDQVERRVMSQRNYTYREVCGLLTDAGFRDVEGFGGLNGEPFTLGAKGLVLVATKPS